VKLHMGVPLQELFDLVGFVRRQIVQDDVNLLARVAAGDHLLEKTHELRTGMPLSGLALHLSRLHIQRSVEGQRTVPFIFKTVPLQSSRRQLKHRIQAVQRLNRSLFIHAKHSRVLRGRQVQSDHVGRFPFEIRIVAGHVALQSVGAHIGLRQNPLDGVFADVKAVCQLPARPVGRTIPGSLL